MIRKWKSISSFWDYCSALCFRRAVGAAPLVVAPTGQHARACMLMQSQLENQRDGPQKQAMNCSIQISGRLLVKPAISACDEMGCVKAIAGPSFGSLWCLSAVLVGSAALLIGIAVALGVAPLGGVFAVAIGGLILSVLLQRTSVVTVDSDGVHWRVAGTEGSAPWSDIEGVDGRLLTGWLVRRSSPKRVYFSVLDPHWRGRAVTEAMQAHLASVNPPTVA
jgi:hypothetical protein